jgi:hypothetical protein
VLSHVMMVKDSRLELEVRFLRCVGAFEQAHRMFGQRWVPGGQTEPNPDARAVTSEGMTMLYSNLFEVAWLGGHAGGRRRAFVPSGIYLPL